jgi:hypothetical protein
MKRSGMTNTLRPLVRRGCLFFWIALRRCPVCHDKLHHSFALRHADPAIMECLRCRCTSYGKQDTTGWWVVGVRRLLRALREIKANNKNRGVCPEEKA